MQRDSEEVLDDDDQDQEESSPHLERSFKDDAYETCPP
jgi:hypothetical protein